MCSLDQFPLLFDEFRPRLHRRARIQLGANASEADDVVMTAYLNGHMHLSRGRSIKDPYLFLCRTVDNLVRDSYRWWRVRDIASSTDDKALGFAETGDITPGLDTSSVERNVMSAREWETLCQAIARLPKRRQHVFVLKTVYGYGYDEIAEQLGISAKTAKKHCANALKSVKADLSRRRRPGSLDARSTRAGRFLSMVRVHEHE